MTHLIDAMAVILVLLAIGFFIGIPILAIVAFARVHRLERRVADLEARNAIGTVAAVPPAALELAPAPATTEAPLEQAPSVSVASSAPVSDPADGITAAPPSAPQTTTESNGTGFDLEAIVAGRWLNRIGLLAVAIGMSYFLKYAIDNAWIGPRGQIAVGLLTGAALIVWSSSLVKRGMAYFADGIAALGAVILYLSLWAASSYYAIVSPTIAFVAMAAVTAATLAIALGRDSQRMAVLAMVGGFLTPALVSTGQDAQVALFLYLMLHNTALLVLVATRTWRFLELPAFVFTQIYFWGWYAQFYTDAALLRTALFATAFFAQFSVLPIVAVRRAGALRPEQALLIPVNACAFLLALHTLLWPDARWPLTLAVLALAIVHMLLARAVSTAHAQVRVLFAGLALTLATLAVPIRLDAQWIAIAWSLEAAVLAWTGFSQRLLYLRVAAYVILVAAVLALVGDTPRATEFLWNARFWTSVVLAASVGAVVWLARRPAAGLTAIESTVVAMLAVGGNVVMLLALTLEVGLYFDDSARTAAWADPRFAHSLVISLLWTLYATTLVLAGARFESAALRWQGLVLFGLTTLKVFVADLSYLDGFYRIVSSIALGVVLLVVSFLYQRSIVARRTKEGGA